MDFVEHLLFAGIHADQAAGARHLGQRKAPGLVELHQREAQVVQVGDLFIARVGVVAAGDLPAALQQMSGQDALADRTGVVDGPAVLIAQGGQGQGGGRPPGR